MKKVFKLEGLNCAHCAAKIEEKSWKIEGVKSVMINFMTTKNDSWKWKYGRNCWKSKEN